MAQFSLPCIACEHFEFSTGDGGFAVFSLLPACKMGLDPEPTDEDPIGCSEFALKSNLQEKLDIRESVEDLIRGVQSGEVDLSSMI